MPSLDSTHIRPLCLSTSLLQIESPIPIPEYLSLVWSFLEEFSTRMGMNLQLVCVKKELKNVANMLNNCTMQMQTLIDQKAKEAA